MTRHPMPTTCVKANSNARPLRIAPFTLVAAAAAVAMGTASGDASALSLGRLRVTSALGEPLRAEVNVAEITAAEAASLRVGIASSDTFRMAGIAYNAALADVRASVQRRADGGYVVLLTSTRGFSDPYVDLLLEANTGSSRVVRDFTLLLDPPSSRPTTAAATPPAPTQVQPVLVPQEDRRPEMQAAAPSPVTAAVVPTPRSAALRQTTVRRGDTASRIADAHRPAEISLDQMLVAMLQANPEAFINGNLNRIRAGALIELPDADLAAAVPATEARRRVVAQSRDFGDYRRRLADSAPASAVAEAGRQLSGKLQASVEDRSAAAGSPDRLTIAQGRMADGQLAQARQMQESNARVAELSRNIGELGRLQAAGVVNGATGAASAVNVLASAVVDTGASPPAATAPAAAGATSAAAVPSPIVAAPQPAGTADSPAAPAESAWYADLANNPIVLGALSLVVLVLGWLAFRWATARRQDTGDSVFLDSRLPKDSFFAGSGGESVDTKNRGGSIVSSPSYSPSQLDTGDVDPVAEADVYLAYGRDLQAEEILREALRVNPERTAIHLKLLEIHAKRRDLRAYESLAMEVRKLTSGTGTEWSRVAEMGNELDAGNSLYGAGARVAALAAAEPATPANPIAATTPAPPQAIVRRAAAAPPAFVPSVMPVDFDLDLDQPDAQTALDSEWVTASLPTQPAPLLAEPSPKPAAAPTAERASPTIRDEPRVLPAPPPPSTPMPPIDLENDFDTEPGALEMPQGRDAADAVTVRGDLKGDSGFIEFDMSAFTGLRTTDSADIEAGGLDPLDSRSGNAESPDAIKLSLALELHALGDAEGARSLVEEVAAENTGELKAKAQQLLAKLN